MASSCVKNTMGVEIPITGRELTPSQYDFLQTKTHVWEMWKKVDGRMKKFYIDGMPTDTSWNLASMINEPSPGETPNSYKKGKKIIIDYNLKGDDEVLLSYGPKYVRDYEVNARWLHRKHRGPHQIKVFNNQL